MAKALDVARCLIHLAAGEDEPEYLCHLRLQKLLYYVQGWSLALRSQPMFPERIEAWAHGPVVRDLYSSFADFGASSIPPDKFPMPDGMAEEEMAFIGEVWNAYRGFSASSLREMTHAESPWKDARNGLQPGEKGDREITHESMKAFFTSRQAAA